MAPSQKKTPTHACQYISQRAQRQKCGRTEPRFHMQCASQMLKLVRTAWGSRWIKTLIQEIWDRPEGPHFQQTPGQCWPSDHALGCDGSAYWFRRGHLECYVGKENYGGKFYLLGKEWHHPWVNFALVVVVAAVMSVFCSPPPAPKDSPNGMSPYTVLGSRDS